MDKKSDPQGSSVSAEDSAGVGADSADAKAKQESITRKILENEKVEMSEDEQIQLSKPLKDESGVDPADAEFMNMVVDKIEKGEINLYRPSTLINESVYDALDEVARGKADVDAFNLLSSIREIHNLWKSGDRESFQIQNAVHRIRVTKERLEEVGGDIFII